MVQMPTQLTVDAVRAAKHDDGVCTRSSDIHIRHLQVHQTHLLTECFVYSKRKVWYLANLIHHLLFLFSFLSKRQQTEVPAKIHTPFNFMQLQSDSQSDSVDSGNEAVEHKSKLCVFAEHGAESLLKPAAVIQEKQRH